ncbi:6-pyruvoyltetrahydropterin/6-carboxytetrahydropterin synthase [Halohasta litchfieldiae]|jgi:6-pyruvoyltetrahydropterin/6-carboxytetrahydropterin synthase|uniref:6-pyruvoyltetrahydropterin/6-carboxytetrahydropterin synthase n=1 Tax=Halohasta litchfieldiae TaxID=1073996 RepID=A0A1H6RUS1_9EURY|nr:6-carboxytetrahydropterin synthase [Halohasta litchfieldiae]ATW89648.1 6-pyruvoyltetrahydropterin/6-carboxytetrahydropterin synthase [Halohasta litchfieldiae]SEI54922.1 6-pyruvoyltetrahydropterin/6-carboxytetrahydropterin synthase [Halohasta litchfieldiae]
MYTVSVRRPFIAQHFLTVPNPGPEGELHSHQFTAVVEFEGKTLTEYGYLVDIDAINAAMDDVIAQYAETTLNDQPAFEGLNPSVEHFSRIFCEGIVETATPTNPDRIRVRLWEDDEASASYEQPLSSS